MVHLTVYDVKRLELYAKNLADYHLCMDLLPALARVYFLNQMGDVHLSPVQAGILMGLGLQHRTVDALAKEFEIPATQLLGLFNRIVRKILTFLNGVLEKDLEEALSRVKEPEMQPLALSLDQELKDAEKELKEKQGKKLANLQLGSLEQFKIKGSEDDWESVLGSKHSGIVSVKSGVKRALGNDTNGLGLGNIEKTKKKKKFKPNRGKGKKR
ncbi:unnamed protein product [Darwinula stevensoni]|uniref:Possible tRNA binding domain-containing protein n=1 Tax=Darwinula stevensoni TaxID=69355 RepID=A0A7R8X8S7_9CRUS|nr:unnamed protein product [Darwinula stevensoni]CAG0884789.1 unnamed protein product [Darwinula stevensoni]